MTSEQAFDLYRQARDRAEEFAAGEPASPTETSEEPEMPDKAEQTSQDEDRLEPSAGAQLQELARLRHSAEMAKHAYELAGTDTDTETEAEEPRESAEPPPGA